MRIAVFGDSIGWGAWDKEGGGWVDRLKRSIIEPFSANEVFNLCDAGGTTARLLKHIEADCGSWLTKEYKKTNIIIIQIGKNDSIYDKDKSKYRVSLKKFEKNLKKIIKISQQYVNKLIFVGALDIDEANIKPWTDNIVYKNEKIKQYEEITQKICKQNNIPFIPLFGKISHKLRYDGIHPNPKGHQQIFEIVRDFLKKQHPNLFK